MKVMLTNQTEKFWMRVDLLWPHLINGNYIASYIMSWPTGLFQCCQGKDVNLNCCIQNTFCGVCVWGSALERASIGNAENIVTAAVVGTFVSSISDNTTIDAVGDGIALGAFIKGRRALVKKYKIDESLVQSILNRLFCTLCAQVQEVNAVLVHENAKYGCASVIQDESAPPSAPQNLQINRRKLPKSRSDL